MSLETLDAPRRALRGGEAADELALFHRTLAEMCRQKLPLPKALRILGEDLGRGRLGREIESMAKEVEQGMP
ncbi:MAG: type II secretion system F family protein, partial [Planctomycetota bacterium]